jgi:hypothetical protein
MRKKSTLRPVEKATTVISEIHFDLFGSFSAGFLQHLFHTTLQLDYLGVTKAYSCCKDAKFLHGK